MAFTHASISRQKYKRMASSAPQQTEAPTWLQDCTAVGITGARWRRGGYHQPMTTEQERTDAASRERSPDHQFTLSIEQTAELYAQSRSPSDAAGNSEILRTFKAQLL